MRFLRLGITVALVAAALGPLLRAEGQQAGKADYVGINNCKMCHAEKLSSWQQKPHARAFELLVAMKQDQNEKCLGCHTTGYGEGGFTSAEKTPDLKGISCEGCHGPGGDHNGDKEKIVRAPSATVCARCHLDASIH